MQARRLSSIPLGASLAMVLVAFIAGTPEASPGLGARPVVLSSPHPGFDARPLIQGGREDSQLLMAQRVRRAKDSDGDGVGDRQDACPDTPMGAGVDLRGCPTDEDQDRVFDGLDQCAETARGATVDAAGCPRDADADGILDGLDLCPDTDQRAHVNRDGCPYDSDGDGVADGLDMCPETILAGEADDSGCSRVQRGEIVLPAIRFGLGSTAIAPGFSPDLDQVARILRQNPDLIVEIGGHTDNEGPARLNRKISLERAEEVKAYMVSQGVPASRMVTKGYGEVHPIASNRYAEGRAQNRRIEIKVLAPQ